MTKKTPPNRSKRKYSWFLNRSWYADYYRMTDDYDFVLSHYIRKYL